MFLVKFATRLLTWKFSLGSTVNQQIPLKVRNICNFFCFSRKFCQFKVLRGSVYEKKVFSVKFPKKQITCK